MYSISIEKPTVFFRSIEVKPGQWFAVQTKRAIRKVKCIDVLPQGIIAKFDWGECFVSYGHIMGLVNSPSFWQRFLGIY